MPSNMPVITSGRVSRTRPQFRTELSEQEARLGSYSEQYVLSLFQKSHLLADEGSYFVATNPTPNTGIASTAALSTLDDTKPFILVKNNDSPGGKRIYLDFLRLIVTAAGTAGTAVHLVTKIDGANVSRYSSGGSTITPVNPNMDSGELSKAQVYAGAVVAAAASTAVRIVDHILIRTVIPVVGDTYFINFGGTDPVMTSMAVAGSAIAQIAAQHVPVVIGPQQTALIHLFLPSQSGASSYEFTLGYWER